MTQPKPFFTFALLFLGLCISQEVLAQEARLLRNPSISENHIAFAYAGDVWLADTDGPMCGELLPFRE